LATLGRSETCDIIIGEKDVSRRHARVERTPEGLRIVDLDSAGGVWVGTEAVKNRVLRPGERVRPGRAIVLQVVAEGGPASGPPPPAGPPRPPWCPDAVRGPAPAPAPPAWGRPPAPAPPAQIPAAPPVPPPLSKPAV